MAAAWRCWNCAGRAMRCENFERVLAAEPGHLDALGNFGNALLKLNRPAEALAAYDRALAIAPRQRATPDQSRAWRCAGSIARAKRR